MEAGAGFQIGDRVEVSGHWGTFRGTVIRILEMRPIQLIIQRDDTQSEVAVRVEYCKRVHEDD
jgi:hypothetical protein